MDFLFAHDGHVYRKHGGDDYEANQVLCDEFPPQQHEQQDQQSLEPSTGDDE